MSELCLLPSAIMTDPRFLSVSLLARYLYLAMDLLADHEGRGPAHPCTWKAQASLWGVAEVDLAAISDAIRALHGACLVVLYDEDQYFFLPDRFEHNRARKFWQASKHPLPPVELLQRYPDYLEGLRRLTTKGRLYANTSEPRRYPELRRRSDRAPASPGDTGELGGKRGESAGSSEELGGIRGEDAGSAGEDPGTWRKVCPDVEVDVEEERESASRTFSSDGDEAAPPYDDIIAYLNAKTGKSFRPSSRRNRSSILTRWKEGHRLPDFLRVIDNMVATWAGDPKMHLCLRPSTLFGPKFEDYLNSAASAPPPAGEAYRLFEEESRDHED